MTLPENVTPGSSGHIGHHNIIHTALNDLDATIAAAIDASTGPMLIVYADDYSGTDQQKANAAIEDAYAQMIARNQYNYSQMEVFFSPRVWDLTGGTVYTTDDARSLIPLPDPLARNGKLATIKLSGVHGATVFRTFDTAPAFNATTGVASMIGAIAKESRIATYSNFGLNRLIVTGIGFDQPSNPTWVCIDARSVTSCDINDIVATYTGAYTNPTNLTGIAVLLPKAGNNGNVRLTRVRVEAYYGVVGFSEHATISDVFGRNCGGLMFYHGLEGAHAARAERVTLECGGQTAAPLLAYRSSWTTPYTSIAALDGRKHLITVEHCEMESDANADRTGPHVLDVNNKIAGTFRYARIRGDDGQVDEDILVSGGTNIEFTNLAAVDPNSGLPIFDIERYGAVANNSTNCTAAIQAAVNAAVAAGGGIVLAPTASSDGVYLLSSALTIGPNGQYAQVHIPHNANSVAPTPVIQFAGPSDLDGGNGASGGGTSGQAAFRTNQTAGGYSATYGWPSVIAAPDFDKSALRVADPNYFTNLHVVWGGINIIQPVNPSLCGLNLESVSSCHVKTLGGWCGTTAAATVPSTPCTNPTGVVLLMPGVGNHATIVADYVTGINHYAITTLAEHGEYGIIIGVFNVIGIAVNRAYNHVAHVSQTVLEQNQYVIAGLDPTTGVIDIPTTSPGGGTRTIGALLMVDALQFEDDNDGNFKPILHIKDANNVLAGVVNYARVKGAFGPIGGIRATGCQQLVTNNLNEPSPTMVPPVGPQVFLAPGLPGFHDNFARRDSKTPGVTSHGGAQWGDTLGRAQIAYGNLRGTAAADNISVIETGVSDGAVSADVSGTTANFAAVFRYADVDNFLFFNPTNGLFKRVAGVNTRIDAFALASASGDRYDVSFIGSTIKVFRTTAAGVVTSLGTVTDSTHLTNTCVGADIGGTVTFVTAFSFGQPAYDTFTRADGALGTSTLGTAWIQNDPELVRVIGNEAGITSAAEARAVIATGLPDGWVRAKFPVLPALSSATLLFRYGDAGNYMGWQPAGGLYKVCGGVVTKVDNFGTPAFANNDVYAVRFEGPHIQVWKNGALLGSVYEPYQQRAPFHGIRFSETTSRMDDFMAHALTAAPYL